MAAFGYFMESAAICTETENTAMSHAPFMGVIGLFIVGHIVGRIMTA